jgi:excisionase family DNA binding protein
VNTPPCPHCGHLVWPEYMDLETAAHYLSIKPSTIRNLASQNEIPSTKLGGSRRYPRKKLDAWAEERMAS